MGIADITLYMYHKAVSRAAAMKPQNFISLLVQRSLELCLHIAESGCIYTLNNFTTLYRHMLYFTALPQ